MGHRVKPAIQLTHGHSFGVDDVVLDLKKSMNPLLRITSEL